ncbi:hypothetical protein [Paraburkholderia hospita]|uniref:hypothetical protein n=1 Tax=Paraburkholderia hospita TaxID=169430 RepID=UPI000B340EE5|nr:hypothetical protein [Paraburkholderia hospita]OUL68689.1 hypothetical protein CA603_51525 [Paraburkholderia hospita]
MMTPAVFRIVDSTGKVLHQGLTSTQADAFMPLLLAGGQYSGVRSERMDAPPQTEGHGASRLDMPPHIAATSTPLPEIESGNERDALREAIESRKDAAKRLADARHAVERAKAFHDARKGEHAALTIAHEAEIRASGANLAEAFKAGGTVAANRLIDRAALTDSETRLATAHAALTQLEAEQAAAEAADKSAETYQQLTVMAVKRAYADELVERLEAAKADFLMIVGLLDAARFSDVPATQRAEQAMHLDLSGIVATTTNAKLWHDFGAALAKNHEAEFGEDQQ